MYNAFKSLCERLLRIPPDPQPPPGDESSTRVYRAASNYYNYLLAIWVLVTVGVFGIVVVSLSGVVVAAIVTVRDGHTAGWLLLIIPVVALIVFVIERLFRLAVLRLNYEKRWYIVTDRSLRVREGVVGVREMTITFANIQNISIAQGPIQRWLHIADLRVDTAGGGGSSSHDHHGAANLHTAWFRGVDNASEVRELIQQRLRQWKDAGLGDQEDMQRENRHSDQAPILAALRDVLAEAQALRQAV